MSWIKIRQKKLMVGLFVSGFFLFGCQTKVKIPQTYNCRQTTGEIKIDGILDEPDWQKADSLSFFSLTRTKLQNHFPAESPTIGKLLWDKDYLYIGIEARDKDIWSTIKKHDGNLWEEDVLEAFFKPDKNEPSYYEFEFSPKNVTLDLFWLHKGVSIGAARSYKHALLFESNLKSAVKIYGSLDSWKDKDDKWVLEVAIPFSAFKEVTFVPKSGDEWSFALCRYDYSVYLKQGVELSSTAKLSKLNFHLWEDYDRLLFVTSGKNVQVKQR